MLLTDLMNKVTNVEPGATLRSHGYGYWSIENPSRRNPGSNKPYMLARIITKTTSKSEAPTNEVYRVKITGNTSPRKQLRTWMILWGVPLE